MLLLKTQHPNPIQVTIDFLQHLHVKVTTPTIRQSLEQHPEYPSLLSIHDAFTSWDIDALAIDAEKERINNFPLPFLAHLTTQGGQFVTVVSVNETTVTYKVNSALTTMALTDFNNVWTGKTLLAQAKETAGEHNYARLRQTQLFKSAQIPLSIVALFVAGVVQCVFVYKAMPWQQGSFYSGLTLVYFLGVLISAALLWYEVDKTNTALQQICTAGAKTNCNAILHSKQAKFLGWLTWSEIGFYYFLGGYLAMVVLGAAVIPLLAVINYTALPYIIFSVYYQWRVVKQWCPLCLAVQAVLLLQGISNVLSVGATIQMESNLLAPLLLCFLVPIAIWNTAKPSLLAAKKLQPKAKELTRLKANVKIFESLLVRQKQITNSTAGLGILLAVPKPKYTIVKVCNPYCGPCAKAHPVLEQLMHLNPHIQVQVIFTATNADTDKRAKPVRHFLALQQQQGVEVAEQAMAYWYSMPTKEYDVLAQKYPVSTTTLQSQEETITAMNRWCSDIDIQFTPTFFINGYQLPDIYTLEELKYLLNE